MATKKKAPAKKRASTKRTAAKKSAAKRPPTKAKTVKRKAAAKAASGATRPKPGSVLERAFKGTTHKVQITASGYTYRVRARLR